MTQPFNLKQALEAYPDREGEIRQEAERIKALSAECGCALGSWSMLAALGIAGVYLAFNRPLAFPGILAQAAGGLVFVFAAGMLGKAVGIGLAKLRLARLYQRLQVQFPLQQGA